MGRIAVKEKKKMEIMGLAIDSRRNWSQHTHVIASDAHKRLEAIITVSHMLDDKSIMRAYKAIGLQERAVALLRNPDPSLLPPFFNKK